MVVRFLAATGCWEREREFHRDLVDAVQAARQATGLTVKRIATWENRGKDYSTYPGLDVKSRELAADYPCLGIGPGYHEDDVIDDTDYAAGLWNLLRDNHRHRPKHDPEILSEAASYVAATPEDERHRLGTLSFSAARWAQWLSEHDIPWPRLESGALDLSDQAFRQMSRQYPEVAPIRELRYSLSQIRLNDLAVGADGRNRTLLSAFRARTGRNQPSNSRFIFGPSCWLLGLIKPPPGRAIAYIDWEQQEWGIAAALSGDSNMLAAYRSADPYLTFAKQADAVPPDATKQTHPDERSQFKVCALAVQYGMGERSLAESLGQSEAKARQLLQLHHETYPRFWSWSQAAVDRAMLHGQLHTVFGWTIHVGPDANPRSLSNFPMQANGAEMLRLACCLATERGIAICAPIHDAVLVEGLESEIDDVVARTQAAMAEASQIVLDGFELRTDANIVRHPDRYMDERGRRMWNVVMEIFGSLNEEKSCTTGATLVDSF